MALGLVVIIIMAILLGFHFVFFKLTQDDAKHFIIYGIFCCYAFSIIIEKNAMPFNMFNNLPDCIAHFFISLAYIFATFYVSCLVKEKLFSKIVIFLNGLAVVVYLLNVIFDFCKILPTFYPFAMLVICVFSLIFYIYSLYIYWQKFDNWYRILLVSMLFMVICFTGLLFFVSLNIKQAYFWAIGFVVYVITYEVSCCVKIGQTYAELSKINKQQKKENQIVKFTSAEKKILEIMTKGETESKAIANLLGKSASTIDTQIRTMLKKTDLSSRLDLVSLYNKQLKK